LFSEKQHHCDGCRGAIGIYGIGSSFDAGEGKSKALFTDDISDASLLKDYARINQSITGRTGIKLHTGEPNGPDILPRYMMKALQ